MAIADREKEIQRLTKRVKILEEQVLHSSGGHATVIVETTPSETIHSPKETRRASTLVTTAPMPKTTEAQKKIVAEFKGAVSVSGTALSSYYCDILFIVIK